MISFHSARNYDKFLLIHHIEQDINIPWWAQLKNYLTHLPQNMDNNYVIGYL